MKIWYVKCNTDIDQYEYISLGKHIAESFETVLEFEINTASDMLHAMDCVAYVCIGDVFEIDGLLPFMDHFLLSE